MTKELPVVVLGGGPVGLAAAAHLTERSIPFLLFESGESVGASIAEWAHVRLFSPWRYSIDPAARRLLNESPWTAPDLDTHPTGGEIIEQYLRPLASLPALSDSIRLGRRVVAVGRLGLDKLKSADRDSKPFVVTVDGPSGLERHAAKAVIDATGTWKVPNPLGADGFEAIGESKFADRIVYGIPDVLGAAKNRYSGKRVAVIGSGHSAQNAVRDLSTLQTLGSPTDVTWVLRRPDPGQMFGGGSDDQLPERGRLGSDAQRLVYGGHVALVSGFRVDVVHATEDGGVQIGAVDGSSIGPFDEIIATTGFRPDLSFLRELRLDLDPVVESTQELAPLIDPNEHSCGSVRPHGETELRHPETGVYLVGAKSYGRAPTFLLATGYEQVRSVVAALAGDFEAAQRLELILPETGVCSSSLATTDAESGCCGADPQPTAESAPTAHVVSHVNGEQLAGSARSDESLEPVGAAPSSGARTSCCG